MNFDQWLVNYTKDLDDTPAIHGAMKDAWNACKKEILSKAIYSNEEGEIVYVKEIENL